MIQRRYLKYIEKALAGQAAVVLLGARQVGKTTLAREVARTRPSVYLDLENPVDLAKLADPAAYLARHQDKLVIMDEIQRAPEIFRVLRVLIDEGRREGARYGRFLLLGSASIELLRQSSETLAGRISLMELPPLDASEAANDSNDVDILWLRGGFPDSFLAENADRSMEWRMNFIKTYLERDVPSFGFRVPAETLRRFWTMLAHVQGGILNASALASGLGVKGQTVTGYVDMLSDLLLVRRLAPIHRNVGKRLVKSPKAYVRDSGLVHALLNIPTMETLYGHPVIGGSWEGFVVEQILRVAPPHAAPGFYRTSAGAEIDLVLEYPDGSTDAVEIKRSMAPKTERGFTQACEDLKPRRKFVVYPGEERYPLANGVEAIGVRELMREIGN